MTASRRIPESDVISVADGFYAAALGDSTWEAALERLFDLMGASLGAITVFDTVSGRLRQSVFHRVGPDAGAEHEDAYRTIDQRLRFLTGGGGVPVYDYLQASETEAEHDLYYAWHTRAAKTRYYIGASVDVGHGLSAALSLHRSREQGQVQARDVSLYRSLLSHFERAMRIAVQVARANGSPEVWSTLVESSPIGMVFLDGSGRPIHANATARRLAALGDGFALGDHAMTALRRGEDALLQRAIGDVLAGSAAVGDEAGTALRLGRRSGEADYLVVTARLPASDRLFSILCPRAVVLITDPTARSGPADERLRMLFGLTPAELRLAGYLVNGATLEEAARLAGVGLPTLRTQLASLFRKTGTGRQSELLRRLLSAPWQIGAG